jgi:hypothetical protein
MNRETARAFAEACRRRDRRRNLGLFAGESQALLQSALLPAISVYA